MWNIGKEFNFCYGHRVHRQRLDSDLSCNSLCKCRHFHGHEGKIIVHLSGDQLDDRGMFIDFNELTWFKKWIDETLDHKMILDINDPALKSFYPILDYLDFPKNWEGLLNKHYDGYFTIKSDFLEGLEDYEREVYEGLILVPFIPTSEKLSEWLWNVVHKKIGHLCDVSRIEFFETPKSQSNYIK